MAYKLPPLYAFSLPPDLLAAFQPRQLAIPEHHPLHPSNRPSPSEPAPSSPDAAVQSTVRTPNGAYTCALTGASFPDLPALREHYKTDWYKYNVKLRLQGKPTGVSEEQFNALVESAFASLSSVPLARADIIPSLLAADLSASISGSDSSEADSDTASDASSSGAISRLLRKQTLASPSAPTEDADSFDPLSIPRSALLWFEAPSAAPETQYGIYRAALPEAGGGKKRIDGPEVLDELRGLQLPEVGAKDIEAKERKWTLLMFGGGHFAGMVVSLAPKLVSRGKGKEKEKELVILEKKTFHRYTTRRKQGGSQGANDNANGKAKSAGAQIRRHNEAALTDEVRALLDSWREEVDSSELVFLRCSKNNYKTFFGYDDAVLTRGDPRIRGYTFPTRRPTINELVRSFTELTRVKVSHLSASALAELDASYLASITPAPAPTAPAASSTPKPASATPKPKLTKLEELERDRWARLLDMVRKGKVDALSAFLDKYGPELEQGTEGEEGRPWGSLPGWMDEARSLPTLLHVASAADQPDLVRWLLEVKRADPTLHLSPSASSTTDDDAADSTPPRTALTPYELARSRPTRNVFRFLTHQHPDWWDWTGTGIGGARVPSGLDEVKEREKEAREEAKREKLREKQRERENKEREEREAVEAEKKRKEDDERRAKAERASAAGRAGPQRLGGGPPRVVQERQLQGLTEEQRNRIAREERARAAEARLKRLG
ncbi:SPOSA6832_03364 [Sporobolomyces salmonicolor]|uniref:SPOSA6832_03364-mRNA-1:cds n=1 Tax=Sporidiobolus salmonicolor TaxID=5005 RepID=A0A0D6ENW3_SPOSA|nr:SPOSA6832_03364 [Sporobolomyces salmonicolor]